MLTTLPMFKPYQVKQLTQKYFGRRRLVGRILHLGGGVQSATLAYMAADGLLDIDLALFADTGDEPFWVYHTIGLLRSALTERGIPIWETRAQCGYNRWQVATPGHPVRGSMPLFVKSPDGGRPGRLRRQCTQEMKITPNEKAVKMWLLQQGIGKLPPGYTYEQEPVWQQSSPGSIHGWDLLDRGSPAQWGEVVLRVPNDVYIETLFGISADEPLRAKERGPKWQKTRYPLIEMGMSREDCVTWLETNDHSVPYKSACIQCPYRSDEAWLWMQQNFPDEFEEACKYDDWLRTPAAKSAGAYSSIRGEMYIHWSCIPLREVNFETLVAARHARQAQSSPFELELLETCSADGGFSCMS